MKRLLLVLAMVVALTLATVSPALAAKTLTPPPVAPTITVTVADAACVANGAGGVTVSPC